MLSLCYLPTAGRLTVTIVKARHLKAMDITGSSGEYDIRYRDMRNYYSFVFCDRFKCVRAIIM